MFEGGLFFNCCCTEENDPDIIEDDSQDAYKRHMRTRKVDVFKETKEPLNIVEASNPRMQTPSSTQEYSQWGAPRFGDDQEEQGAHYIPPPDAGGGSEQQQWYAQQQQQVYSQQQQWGAPQPQEQQWGAPQPQEQQWGAPQPQEQQWGTPQPQEQQWGPEGIPSYGAAAASATSPTQPRFPSRSGMEEARRAAEEEADNEGPVTFTAILDKPGKIGLNVRHHNATMLEILTIKEGLIKDYNDQITSGAIQGIQVQIGDVINKVNGETGSAPMLLKTIADSGRRRDATKIALQLGFIRGLSTKPP